MPRTIRLRATVLAGTAIFAAALALIDVPRALAQSNWSDPLTEYLTGKTDKANAPKPNAEAKAESADPRADDPDYQRSKELMSAIDALLADAAKNRSEAAKLPGRDEFLVPPIWTETREDRQDKIRRLMDAALGVVTDVPVVEVQGRVEKLRRNIGELEDQIVALQERKLTAPEDGMLPGVFTDTVASLETNIEEARKKIAANQSEIESSKREISDALKNAGIKLGDDQINLLLDSVLSGDLVRLVAVFNAAKLIDRQLGERMELSGDNIKAARKYFAMHAALFAMLVHAQDSAIEKIDRSYIPKLDAILRDIRATSEKTDALLKKTNRPDQRRVLEANRESQKLARDAAQGYRRYLQQQREQIARARARATHDLSIADNTFETVEASFQLRILMRDAAASFEAIEKLEAPTFDQIFRNEELRREFENLTRKLEIPTS